MIGACPIMGTGLSATHPGLGQLNGGDGPEGWLDGANPRLIKATASRLMRAWSHRLVFDSTIALRLGGPRFDTLGWGSTRASRLAEPGTLSVAI
jgi:hypothetical protein